MSEGKRSTRRVPYICELKYDTPKPPERKPKHEERKQPPSMRVCLAGPAGSGKTSLLCRWRGMDLDFAHPTCGANYTEFVRRNSHGDDYTEQVWDTAGQEVYASLLPFYMRGADVAVLVFEVGKFSAAGFEAWLERLAICREGTRLVVVCNKSDLASELATSERGVLETFEACREVLARDPGRFVLLGMFFTSCRTGSCCEETHACILGHLGELARSKPTPRGKPSATRTGTAADAGTQTEPGGCC